MKELERCMICPRACGINRNTGKTGYCQMDADWRVASVCIHMGEEPAISGSKGICNIFFRGCNMRCIYCQNFQISQVSACKHAKPVSLKEIIDTITGCIENGIRSVGFVSPSHYSPHVIEIIHELHRSGYHPVTVYNTNSFDNIEVIKSLEGLIDVYLPDLKYMSAELSKRYSDAPEYPAIAKEVILEMFRQKGSTLVEDEDGQAVTGMIVRHLVLPGHTDDSIKVLDWVADHLSTSITLSLMSQYYPAGESASHSVLGRKITEEEYNKVVAHMELRGFYKGWIQEFESAVTYKPDFSKQHPFES